MTTPSTPDAPTRRSRRTRLIAIAVGSVLLLLLVIVLVVGRVSASNRVDTYTTAFDDWKNNDRNTFTSVATDLPEGLYDSDTSADTFARQREACTEVAAIGGEVDDRASSMPVVRAGFWGAFSGDLREAARTSERRADQLTAARRVSEKAIEQIRIDCRWNIDQNIDERVQKLNGLEERAEKLLDPEGAEDTVCSGGSCTTYTCTTSDGCLPFDKADLRRYGQLSLEADKLRRATDQTDLAEDKCGRTSYGPLCETLREQIAKVNDASQQYDRAVRDGAEDGPVDRAIDAREDAVDDLADVFEKVLESERPDLARRDGSLAEDPGNNDRFLLRASDLLMADVAAAVKPIEQW